MLSIKELKNGEKLFVLRRRVGNTQAQEAEARGIPLTAYKALEVDDPCDWNLRAEGVGKVAPHEICVALRRREGWSLEGLANATGMSRFYLCLIEKGKAPVDTLAAYWEDVRSRSFSV